MKLKQIVNKMNKHEQARIKIEKEELSFYDRKYMLNYIDIFEATEKILAQIEDLLTINLSYQEIGIRLERIIRNIKVGETNE